jgi:hypothetical protein
MDVCPVPPDIQLLPKDFFALSWRTLFIYSAQSQWFGMARIRTQTDSAAAATDFPSLYARPSVRSFFGFG